MESELRHPVLDVLYSSPPLSIVESTGAASGDAPRPQLGPQRAGAQDEKRRREWWRVRSTTVEISQPQKGVKASSITDKTQHIL